MAGGIRDSGNTTLSEINVTPLVDVMLVLLIVFMISAPMMNQGFQVDLPRTQAQTLDDAKDPIELVLKPNGQILMDQRPVRVGDLETSLRSIAASRPNIEVHIKADRSLSYGTVAEVMSAVKRAQIHRVGLSTAPITSRNQP